MPRPTDAAVRAARPSAGRPARASACRRARRRGPLALVAAATLAAWSTATGLAPIAAAPVASVTLAGVGGTDAAAATASRATPGVRVADTHGDVFARHAVAADHPEASAAGALVLAAGGNAVDAAVAASFALSVVRPMSCGIGGGGFMLVHVPGDGPDAGTFALDYRESAPARITPDWYERLGEDGASRTGVHAVAVPGTVAGLLTAHGRWGRLPRAVVLEPALRLARDGFRADAFHASIARVVAEEVEQRPEIADMLGTLWTVICRRGAVEVGATIRNPAQARALERIVEHGRAGFYEGPVATAIAQVVERGGGPLSRDDLAAYAPRELAPVTGTFLGRTVVSMPPPSSGGIAILQALTIIEASGIAEDARAPHDPAWVHAVAEALKHAFADRSRWLADPDFVDVPVDRLLDPELLRARAASLSAWTRDADTYGVIPAPEGAPVGANEDGGTSHVSVIDADGMAVACTETINLLYGSKVEVPGFGFALNDEMDDFTTVRGEANAFGLRQSDDNLPAPGKRPLSSMSPTIVLAPDGTVELVAGASGGPRIITGTLQAILNALVFEFDAGEAVSRPRFHHQWMPHVLFVEDRWDRATTLETLEARGHEVRPRGDVGHVQVLRRREDGRIEAASDPRKGGRPAGH